MIMRMKPVFRPILVATALGALAWPASARAADEVAACVKASEQAQSLKDEGKLKRARDQLLICARDVCPSVVKKDCVQGLAEVDGSMPSVVMSAKDARGRDLSAVKVSIDGVPLTDRLDGKPQPIDPGEHLFRFELAGSAPTEEKVVIRTGEKNRAVSIQFPLAEGAPPAAETPAPAPTERPAAKPPIAGYVIGGIGVVALGGFAIFGISGKNAVSDMRDGPTKCAPTCDQSRVDSARTKLVLADVSLGIGVVAIGVATYLILTNKAPETAPAAAMLPKFDFRALPGGGVAQVAARF